MLHSQPVEITPRSILLHSSFHHGSYSLTSPNNHVVTTQVQDAADKPISSRSPSNASNDTIDHSAARHPRVIELEGEWLRNQEPISILSDKTSLLKSIKQQWLVQRTAATSYAHELLNSHMAEGVKDSVAKKKKQFTDASKLYRIIYSLQGISLFLCDRDEPLGMLDIKAMREEVTLQVSELLVNGRSASSEGNGTGSRNG